MRSTITRRNFLQRTSLGCGLTILAGTTKASAASTGIEPRPREKRLPREVWIATISQNRMEAGNYEEMIRKMLSRMEQVVSYQPDIICLPEVFPFANLSSGRPPISDVAEVPIGEVSKPFAEFARKYHCYVVCPIYTKSDGRYYNAAVFIDSEGKLLGEYRKIHPTIGEMENGITPGPLQPPVFKTEFGIVGAQICFDIEWYDGWQNLRKADAEMVFWPSAFAGGSVVNTKAWQNKYVVVSSTRKDTSKICDISGEELASTNRWNDWACALVNLEKAFLHTWPFCRRFQDVQAKYGRKIRIKTFAEEEWSIIESRSPDVKIAEVMKEFEFQTHEEHIQAAEQRQKKERP
ncbi:MAG: carbon-nitrogen hydrolase family protein [Planctomycetota bacterium]|jgi:predicted amidohydrolase